MFTATLNDVNGTPAWVNLISGSPPRFPITEIKQVPRARALLGPELSIVLNFLCGCGSLDHGSFPAFIVDQ